MSKELDYLRESHWRFFFPYVQSFFYFGEGFSLGSLILVIPLFITRVLGRNEADAGIAASLAGLPWFLKFVYGAFTDKFPIGRFGRRKPYLLLTAVIATPLWFTLSQFSSFSGLFLVVLVLVSTMAAVADTTLDGLIVDITPVSQQQVMQSVAWGGRSVGTILAALISLRFAENNEFSMAFALAGGVFFVTTLSSLLFPELEVEKMELRLIHALRVIFQKKGTYYLIISGIALGAGQVMFSFSSLLLENQGLSDLQLRHVTSLYYVGNVIGALGIGVVSKIVRTRSERLLVYILAVAIVWSPMIYVVESFIFLQVFFFILGVILFAAVAVFSKITMNYSPVEASSTMFAFFASVSNLGLVVIAPLYTGYLLTILPSVTVLLLASLWFFVAILFVLLLGKVDETS